jgi:hypothetical protein
MNKVLSVFYHYSGDNFEDRVNYARELFNKGMDIYNIRRLVSEKYNIPFHEKMISLDCMYHAFYSNLKIIYKIENIDDITDRLPINLRDNWRERFEYRNFLLKENKLSYIDIEKEVNHKYNIQCELSLFENKIDLSYDIISVINSLNKKGRPRIPSYLKEENYEKNKEKMKENMKVKYDLIKDIKSHMLTTEEFNKIKDKLQDETILKKIKYFVN